MEESGVHTTNCGEGQMNFEFYDQDRPCRTCVRFWRDFGVVDDVIRDDGLKRRFTKEEREVSKWWYGCRAGQFPMTSQPHKCPSTCNSYKGGGEVMAFVDFKNASEEELRAELEKIRSGRRGVGKKKRTESKERRVSGGQSSKPKEIIKL